MTSLLNRYLAWDARQTSEFVRHLVGGPVFAAPFALLALAWSIRPGARYDWWEAMVLGFGATLLLAWFAAAVRHGLRRPRRRRR